MTTPVAVGISLRQPWLDLIVRGAKSVEIRSWTMPIRGLVALHAARNVDFGAAYFYGYRQPWSLARGAVLAVAVVATVERLDRERWGRTVYLHRQPVPPSDVAYAISLR